MTRVVLVHTSSLVNLAVNTRQESRARYKAHSERIKTFVPWNEYFFYRWEGGSASANARVSAETNFHSGFNFILFRRRYFFMRHLSNWISSSPAMCFRMWPTVILYGFRDRTARTEIVPVKFVGEDMRGERVFRWQSRNTFTFDRLHASLITNDIESAIRGLRSNVFTLTAASLA